MKKPLEKIVNYFTGREILQHYNDLEKKSPEFYEDAKLGKQKVKNYLLCSALPNIVSLSAGIYAGITNDYLGGGIIICISENNRSDCRHDFKMWQNSDNVYAEAHFCAEKAGKASDELHEVLISLNKKVKSGELKLKRKN
jgi:hypothetical protein